MAKTVRKTATASTAYGEPIKLPNGDTSISFPYDYVELESMSEVPDGTQPDGTYDSTKDERPTEKQILNLVNSLRNATHRNKAQAVAFDAAGIKAPSVDPAESRRRTFIKVLVADGNSPEAAEKLADQFLKGK
jgi:hypothetical protein